MVYQGRFGFHSADYETYKKLKFLYKHYWQTVYQIARWRRWDRKTVHQIGPEPSKGTEAFVNYKGRWVKFVNKEGFSGMRHESVWADDRGIVKAFHNARMPQKEEKDVIPLGVNIEFIDKLYNEVKLLLV